MRAQNGLMSVLIRIRSVAGGGPSALSLNRVLRKCALAVMMAGAIVGIVCEGALHAASTVPGVPDHFISQGQKSEVMIATGGCAG